MAIFFKRLCKEYICDPGFISGHFEKFRLKKLSLLLLLLLLDFFSKIIVENQTITLDMISTMLSQNRLQYTL